MTKETTWIVTTAGDRALADIARDLSRAGFTVRQRLDEAGIIAGSATEEVARKLRTIGGVVDVSPDHSIDIGPPDAPVTW